MAAITVKREGTGHIITFDTVAEVGSAAEFISYIEKAWGEGVLLKPSSTSAFTARTPEPFPHGIYTFLPKSGTSNEVLLALVEIKSLLQVHSVLQLDRFTYTEGKVTRKNDPLAHLFSRSVKAEYGRAKQARTYAIRRGWQPASWDFEDYLTEGMDLSEKLKICEEMDLAALRQQILSSNQTANEKAADLLLESEVNDLSRDEWRELIAGIPADVKKEIGMLKSAGRAMNLQAACADEQASKYAAYLQSQACEAAARVSIRFEFANRNQLDGPASVWKAAVYEA
ncbi:TPA: hypothetical protein ACH3X1_013122 [Trebouxia sp. C0004]